jgi:hypothetical protein
MTDIHRADCTCDRCINQLADAILGNLDKPSRLPAEMRFRPMRDIPEERQTEWHFSNGNKLVFRGEPEPYRGMPEPLIADFGEEPTLIEETPAGLRERLDAVNARLAALEKEDIDRATRRLDMSTEAVIARKRAAGTLSDPETCEHLFSWRLGYSACRQCGAPPRTPDDEWEPEHWAIVRDGKVVASGSRPAPDYEAMGYPETAVYVDLGRIDMNELVGIWAGGPVWSLLEDLVSRLDPSEENNEAR